MAVLNTVHPSATEQALLARIAELEAAQAAKNKLTFKIGEKGALSIYGLGRFPVTAYIGQWERIWGAIPEMKAFAQANANKLSRKG